MRLMCPFWRYGTWTNGNEAFHSANWTLESMWAKRLLERVWFSPVRWRLAPSTILCLLVSWLVR
jgi:hypothetical protein